MISKLTFWQGISVFANGIFVGYLLYKKFSKND